MILHLLRYQGFVVGNYNFTLGCLEAGAPSTFAHLGYKKWVATYLPAFPPSQLLTFSTSLFYL
jgi:hypothetical protein